jgi:hypothetical protein
MAAPPSEDQDDDGWKFSVEEVGPQDERTSAENEDKTESEPGGNVAGTLQRNQPLEPGDIDPENAAFVILGVVVVLVLIVGAILSI